MADDPKPAKVARSADKPAYRVTAKPETFRRAGLAFTRDPREFLAGELSADQVKALKGEAMLVVEEL